MALLTWMVGASILSAVVGMQVACPFDFPSYCRCQNDSELSAICTSDHWSGLESDIQIVLRSVRNLTLVGQLSKKATRLSASNILGSQESFTGLRVLRLKHNLLEMLDLDKLLCALPNLEELYVANNTVVQLRVDVQCTHSLRVLDLRYNHLHWLTHSNLLAIGQMPLVDFRLGGNTFTCDCNFIATLRWLKENSRRLELGPHDSYKCADGFPEYLEGRSVFSLNESDLQCEDDTFSDESIVPNISRNPEALVSEVSAVLYGVVAFLIVMATVLGIFAFYTNFPNVIRFARKCKKNAPPINRHKHYSALDRETAA